MADGLPVMGIMPVGLGELFFIGDVNGIGVQPPRGTLDGGVRARVAVRLGAQTNSGDVGLTGSHGLSRMTVVIVAARDTHADDTT